MKYLLLALFLISFFQFSTKADDIREFELEGMSVGESLLKFKDKKFIQNRLNDSNTFFYKNKTFACTHTHMRACVGARFTRIDTSL